MGSAQDAGWTVVHYGKKHGYSRNRTLFDNQPRDFRERPQYQASWNRGGGGIRGTDRAPPVSRRGGQVQFSIPNRPAPPLFRARSPVSGRYLGPQSRSYAAVTRQNTQSRAFGNGNFPTRGQRPYQRPKQQLREFPLNRNQPFTPADPKFGQLVRKLHKVIKMVHHLQNITPEPGKAEPKMISRMVENLATMIKPASPTSGTVDLIVGNAKNWGYNTLVILEDHYKAGLESLVADLSNDLTPDWKTAFGVAVKWAHRNLPRIRQEVIDHAEALIMASMAPGRESAVETQAPQQKTTQQPQHTTTDPPQHATTQQPQAPRPTHTEQGTETPQPVVTGGEDRETGLAPQSPQRDSPKQQRPRLRSGRQNTCVLQDDSPLLGVVEETTAEIHHTENGSRRSQVDDNVPPQTDPPIDNTSTPQPHMYKVKRHISTERKMSEWGLCVCKKYLIIGDSNLSRMPMYKIPDLQIESYPGANFRHAQSVLSKASKHVIVEKVVLSFGINCRGQKAKETAIKQMQAALRTAKKQFPYAEVWIPLINYSALLKREERVTLQTINGHITRNMPFLPPLPTFEFHTEKDHVHWTKETARAMLEHWGGCLNFKAP